MKKLILMLPIVLMSCGESKKEKDARLDAQMKHNLDSALTQDNIAKMAKDLENKK